MTSLYISIKVAQGLESLSKLEVAEPMKMKKGFESLFNLDRENTSWSLRRNAEFIQERIELAEEIKGIEGKLARYNGLTWVRNKIVEEYGDSLKEYMDIPIGKIIMSSNAIDFGDTDYYHLEDLADFIINKTKDEDESYWVEEIDSDYPRGIVLLCQLLFVLRMELDGLYNLLDSVKHRPEEPVASIQEILERLKVAEGNVMPHFNLKIPDINLIAILNGLKEAEWRNRRLNDIGLVGDDITDDEWLYVFKGPAKGRPNLTRKLPWKAEYVCKTFVEQFLDGNYSLAQKVFCWTDKEGNHDMDNLQLIKNNRRDDICNPNTGLIAKIIAKGKGITDKKSA